MIDRWPAIEAGYHVLTAGPRHLVSRELTLDMKSQIAAVRGLMESAAGFHTDADCEPCVGYFFEHSAGKNSDQYDSMVRIGVGTLAVPDSDALVSVTDHICVFAAHEVVETALDTDGGAVANYVDVVDAAPDASPDAVVEPVVEPGVGMSDSFPYLDNHVVELERERSSEEPSLRPQGRHSASHHS